MRTFLFIRGAHFDVVLCASFLRRHGALTFPVIFEQIDGLVRGEACSDQISDLKKSTVLSLIERV